MLNLNPDMQPRERLNQTVPSLRADLAPPEGGFYSRGDWEMIQDRAAQAWDHALKASETPASPQTQQEAWIQVVRDFHQNRQWGFRPSRHEPAPRQEPSPIVKEMIPYLWILIQAGFVMKIVIYYFGLRSATDPSPENDLLLIIALGFSFFSLTFFAWRMYRRDMKLTPLQYRVTQENGTEPPFQNEYWDEKRDGIYVDRVSGEPLFSSSDKFDSGTGWPSFTRPLNDTQIRERTDVSHGMTRTEVRSTAGNCHLGHVFEDGPQEAGGKRYCMNSAALRFIPKEDLEKEGYGKYLSLFESKT